ncbi:DUF4097 domain-containing protein [Chloroflexota bacterium]
MRKPILVVLITILSILLLFSVVSSSACKISKETKTNTFTVGSNPVVQVETGNGNIDLVVGTDGTITVISELQNPDIIEYQVSQDGDSITVKAKTRSNSRADITVTLPAKTEFVLSTGNGDVNVADVQAPGQMSSGNGSLSLTGVNGNVTGNVGNGDINISDVMGSLFFNAGNGKITLRKASGVFTLNAGNGRILATEVTGEFNLNAGNGNVEFKGELTSEGDNDFSSGNGSITAELMGSPSVILDLETDDGVIKVDLPVTISEQSKYRLAGTIGDGEANLTVQAGSGDIIIK